MSEIQINREYQIDLNIAQQSLNKSHLMILDRMLKDNGKNKVFVTDTTGGFCLVVGKQSDSPMGKLKIPMSCLKKTHSQSDKIPIKSKKHI